ncbi:hypothetical protein ACN28S_61785 [Cystobacter fuscus]
MTNSWWSSSRARLTLASSTGLEIGVLLSRVGRGGGRMREKVPRAGWPSALTPSRA